MSLEPWLRVLYAARGEPGWTRALRAAGSVETLADLDSRRLAELGVHEEALARLHSPDAATLDAWRRWLQQPDQDLVPFGSESYPKLLADTPDAPPALWIRGTRADLLNAPQLAIVGSRNASRSGRLTAEELARYLSKRGLTITSGLATGIDAAAHAGALRGVGGTVAVFGCGIDTVFPRSNSGLARDIAAAGLLVSEYPPGVPPLAHHFPRRNRIIACLSIGTLVVEAGRRSGSLITARLAVEAGREVFAVPGSIHHPLSRGCHALLRQGAKLVEEGADVLIELAPRLQLELEPLPSESRPEASSEASVLDDPAYVNLLNLLDFSPQPIAEISARCGLTAAELSSMLLVLELEGLVEALPGGRYSRLPKRSR